MVSSSLFPVNLITGISDGLILPFAVCIIAYPYFSDSPWKLVAVGIVIALVGAIVFGLARFLGEREEIHHHHPQIAEAESEQEMKLMKAIGIEHELTEDMKMQMEEERVLWLREVRENNMDWEYYDPVRARKSGMQTAAGFFMGGFLACLPFGFMINGVPAWTIPCISVFLLLYFFGWCKGFFIGKPPIRTALFQLAIGLAITLCALLIGKAIYAHGYTLDFISESTKA